MSNLICVQGCTFKCTFSAPITSASASVNGSPSSKVKCGGKTAWTNSIPITVSGASSDGGAPIGSASIQGNSTKAKSVGKSFVLDNAGVDVTVNWTNTATGVAMSGTVKVEIDNPGQDKVKVT